MAGLKKYDKDIGLIIRQFKKKYAMQMQKDLTIIEFAGKFDIQLFKALWSKRLSEAWVNCVWGKQLQRLRLQ